MDMNSWSLVLSIVGLLLGLVSAFAQLKAVAVAALRLSGDKARLLARRVEAQGDLFAKSPSALIAYLVESALYLVAIILASSVVLRLAQDPSVPFPAWVILSANFIAGGLGGIKVGSLTGMMRLVRRKVMDDHRASLPRANN